MHQTHLSSIDLNLLVALESLLRHRSVTDAANEVGLSQPAMSRALGRLRELFDDPLLLRAGQSMMPTPRAIELEAPLDACLAAIRKTLEPAEAFEPRHAKRSFRIAAVDTTQTVILPEILRMLVNDAPQVEVSTAPILSTQGTFDQLASGERDFAVGRFESPPDAVVCDVLYWDEIVCLVRQEHPRIRDALSMERYLAESHLAAESRLSIESPFTIEALLAAEGMTRHVACKVENLAMAPFIVARTDLIATAPGRTIRPFAEGLNLRILPPPFRAPGFPLQLAWHRRNEDDGGHRWMRERIIEIFAQPAEN